MRIIIFCDYCLSQSNSTSNHEIVAKTSSVQKFQGCKRAGKQIKSCQIGSSGSQNLLSFSFLQQSGYQCGTRSCFELVYLIYIPEYIQYITPLLNMQQESVSRNYLTGVWTTLSDSQWDKVFKYHARSPF